MAAVKAAFAVSQRVRRSFQLSQIIIGPLMELADQVQVIVQFLEEVPALLPGLCQDHREMQADSSHIKPPNKDGHILFIRRLHAAPLEPGGQKCPAAHRADDLSILLIHTGHIAFPGKA